MRFGTNRNAGLLLVTQVRGQSRKSFKLLSVMRLSSLAGSHPGVQGVRRWQGSSSSGQRPTTHRRGRYWVPCEAANQACADRKCFWRADSRARCAIAESRRAPSSRWSRIRCARYVTSSSRISRLPLSCNPCCRRTPMLRNVSSACNSMRSSSSGSSAAPSENCVKNKLSRALARRSRSRCLRSLTLATHS